MSRSTLYIPQREHYYVSAVFGVPGDLAVGAGIHAPVEVTVLPGWKVRFLSAWCNVETEPVGADITLDIKYSYQDWSTPKASRSWNTVFGADAPRIPNGSIQNSGAVTRFAANPMEFHNIFQPEATTKKLLLRGDIVTVGSDSPGKSLTMSLEMVVLLDYPD